MRRIERAEDLYKVVSSKGVDIWEYVKGLEEDERQAVLRVLKDSMKYVTISKEGESYVTSEEVTASYNVSGRALPEEEGYSTEFMGVCGSEGEENDLKVTKVSRGVYEVRKKVGEGSYGRAEIMEYEVNGKEGEESVKCLVKKSSFREELEQEYEGWQREHQPIIERYLSLSSDDKRARFISENSQIIKKLDSAKLQLIREGHRYPMPSLLQRVVQVTEDPKVVKQVVDEMGYLTTTRIYGELVNLAGSDGNTAFQIARAKHIDVARDMLKYLSLYGEVKEEIGAGREGQGVRMQINTHTSSVNRSTDISVVKLFERYVEENGIRVDYEKLEEWKIRIKDRAREEVFAARMEEEIAILHAKVDEWDSLDEEELRSKGTAAMSESELVTLKKNLKYAKRLLDNIKENGMLSVAGSDHTNDSRSERECGLTIKEIMGLVSYYVRSCRGVEMRAGVAEEKQQEDLMIRYMQHLKEIRREYNISDEEEVDKNKCEQGTVNHLVYVLHGVQADVKVWSVGNAVYQSMYQEWIREKLRQMLENEEEREVGLRIIKEALFKGGIDKSVYNLHFREYVEAKFRERFGGYLEPAEEYYGNEKIKERAIGKLDIGEELREIGYRIEIDGLDGIEGVRALISYGPKVFVREGEGYVHIMQMLKERREDLYRGYIEYLRGEGLEELLRVGAYMIEEEQAVEMIEEVIGREEADERVKDMLRANIKEQPRFIWPVIRDMRGMGRENLYHLAVEANFWQMVKAILSIMKDPNIPNRDGDTALLVALKKGYKRLAEILMKDPKVDVNKPDSNGNAPLHYCIENGDMVTFEALKERSDIDMRLMNQQGHNPLMVAIKHGHLRMIAELLSREDVDIYQENPKFHHYNAFAYATKMGMLNAGRAIINSSKFDVNRKNSCGFAPIHFAVIREEDVFLRALMKRPELDFNATTPKNTTALISATKLGVIKPLSLLLQQDGVDLNIADITSQTALHYAINSGNKVIVSMLLNRQDIRVNKATTKGQSPLIYAAIKGDLAIVNILLASQGVDLNSRNSKGQTSLMNAVAKAPKEVVEAIISREGCDCLALDMLGCSVVHYAAIRADVEILRLISSRDGVFINMHDHKGRNAVVAAIEFQKHEIIEELVRLDRTQNKEKSIIANDALMYFIKAKKFESALWLINSGFVDVNLRYGRNKATPLICAIERGGVEVVRALTAIEDIRINEPDSKGDTPLMKAVRYGDGEIIELIMRHKDVDINAVNRRGQTAACIATKRGDEALAVRLKTKMKSKDSTVLATRKRGVDNILRVADVGALDVAVLAPRAAFATKACVASPVKDPHKGLVEISVPAMKRLEGEYKGHYNLRKRSRAA